MAELAPLILARKPREDMRHHAGASCIGGLPALAGHPWPRGRDGVPLSFLAQIDLGMVAVMRPEAPLPRDGALLFFAALHGGDHAVLHVPLNHDFATPPDDLPPLYGADFASVFRFAPCAERAPRMLPRWPVALHPAPWDHDETAEFDADDPGGESGPRAAARAAARALGARDGVRLSVNDPTVAAALPQFDMLPWLGVHWNHSLHLYGDSLIQVLRSLPRQTEAAAAQLERGLAYQKGLVVKPGRFRRKSGAAPAFASESDEMRFGASTRITDAVQAELEERARLLPAFHTLVAEVAEWTDRRPTWEEICPEDRRRLVATADRLENDFRAFGPMPYGRSRLYELGNDTLRHMAHGAHEVWQRLPRAVRDHINRHERMPWIEAGWHQVLGHGRDIQGGVDEMARDNVLLLQLVADDFICLDLGDGGTISFWITPEAARAGAWDAVDCLVEAH